LAASKEGEEGDEVERPSLGLEYHDYDDLAADEAAASTTLGGEGGSSDLSDYIDDEPVKRPETAHEYNSYDEDEACSSFFCTKKCTIFT